MYVCCVNSILLLIGFDIKFDYKNKPNLHKYINKPIERTITHFESMRIIMKIRLQTQQNVNDDIPFN